MKPSSPIYRLKESSSNQTSSDPSLYAETGICAFVAKGDNLRFDISHGSLAYAAFGERVTVAGEFAYFADGVRHISTRSGLEKTPVPPRRGNGTACNGYNLQLAKGQLAADEMLPLDEQNSPYRYRFTITLTQEPEDNVTRLYRTPTLDSAKALQLASAPTSP